MGLTTLVGTFDAIVVPLLLDKNRALSYFPPSLRGDLCTVGAISEVLEGPEVPDGKHPVFFVLGRQSQCGPTILPWKMTFQEAKLEVPFLRHTGSGSEVPHLHKSMTVFDSQMMSMSSQHIAGLRSRFAHFTPPQYSFSTINKDRDDVIYGIEGVLELKLSRDDAAAQEGPSPAGDATAWLLNVSAVKKLLELPWVGEDTGTRVSRFVYDWAGAEHPIEPIKVDLVFSADWFSYAPAEESSRARKAESDQAVVNGITAFRFCAQFKFV